MELVINKNGENSKPNYKELYYATYRRLSDVSDLLLKAQIDIEEMYLRQTDPTSRPPFAEVSKVK